MGARLHESAGPMVVATVPPRVPVLQLDDMPGDDDWAVLSTLGVDQEDAFDHDLQYDRYGSLRLAPAAFE